MREDDIYAVVPAYNAESAVVQVITGLRSCGVPLHVVVVDDGSTDRTISALSEMDVTILKQPQNQGKGAALRRGFEFALSKNAAFVLTIDADGQHRPAEVWKLVEAVEQENLDIVIGCRRKNLRQMPLHRVLSNVITSKLISWRIGQVVEDSQSGFRLIRAEVLKGLTLGRSQFDLESEMLIKAGLRNFRIGSVTTETIYRVDGTKVTSYMNVKDVFRFISLYLGSLTWKRTNQS